MLFSLASLPKLTLYEKNTKYNVNNAKSIKNLLFPEMRNESRKTYELRNVAHESKTTTHSVRKNKCGFIIMVL